MARQAQALSISNQHCSISCMARTSESVSEPLRFSVRISPGNVDLAPGNPEFDAKKAATIAAREQRYIGYMHAKADAGELDLSEWNDRDRIIAAQAGL